MVYKASLDKLAIGITISTVILLMALPFFLIDAEADRSVVAIIVFTELLTIAGWGYHPTGYSINGTHLVIHRPIKNLFIDRNRIEAAFEIPKEDISYSIRIFGAGGFFGYFGKFANKKLGSMTWYATRRDSAVLIKTEGKKLIVTPDFPDGFVKELNITERN